MTCDSMVRWPKELKVFRCAVCLTINDLKPVVLEARRGDGHRAPVPARAGTYPRSGHAQKGGFYNQARVKHCTDVEQSLHCLLQKRAKLSTSALRPIL